MRVLASFALRAIPFDYLAHLVTVPVTINGSLESRFVLDSGIGLTLVSAAVADLVGASRAASGSAAAACRVRRSR